MARLESICKAGFYPTPENTTSIICKYLRRQHEGLIKILDPCAGEGVAVKTIGDYLQAETYGIEIDIERGNQAKEILTKCIVTDYQNTRITKGAFSLLYNNPPYDFSVRETELETSERYERTFLRDTIPYLCKNGILAYLIPEKRLDGRIANIISYRFQDINVCRFPEDEYERFKQIVIFGRLKPEPSKDDKTTEFLKKVGQLKTIVPFLPEEPDIVYDVPLSPAKSNFIFRSKDIDPDELAAEIEDHGLFQQIKEITTPLSMTEKIQPIMPLRHGHLAQILSAGLLNGIVWDKDRKNPLLIKGITRKDIKHKVETVSEITEKHIATEQIEIIINAFKKDGTLLTIQ